MIGGMVEGGWVEYPQSICHVKVGRQAEETRRQGRYSPSQSPWQGIVANRVVAVLAMALIPCMHKVFAVVQVITGLGRSA